MADAGHLGVARQEADNPQRVLHVPLHTQREGLEPLQQDKGVERRQGRSRVAQQDGTDTGDKGCPPGNIGKDRAVIRRVGLGQRGDRTS